jgi:hypothetical protein
MNMPANTAWNIEKFQHVCLWKYCPSFNVPKTKNKKWVGLIPD